MFRHNGIDRKLPEVHRHDWFLVARCSGGRNRFDKGPPYWAGMVYGWEQTVPKSPKKDPVPSEVVLRLALPEERLRWDALMDTLRFLGSPVV